ncbi:MAG: hypothetical protein Q7N50_02770 [Armatimonadota bacterium]|nr:hypothetical protein [Armatimonadota bacterium]
MVKRDGVSQVENGVMKVSLEDAADGMLADCEFMPGDTQLFTERQLIRKIKRDIARAPAAEPEGIPNEVAEYLIDRHISLLLKNARLTKFQRRVYSLYLRGGSPSEIARESGISRQRVANAILTARQEVSARRNKYAGLHEVYWKEVRRHIYRKPRHRR